MHKVPQHMQTTIELQHPSVEHIAVMHFVSPHMQNTIAQHQQKKRKRHLEPSVPLRTQIEHDSTLKRRRLQPSRTRGKVSPQRNLRLPEKYNVSCKS